MKSKNSDFFEKVYEIVKLIPAGKVSTYGAIAKRVGIKSAARTVGWALNSAKNRSDIPFHRVVDRNGYLSGAKHFATPTLMRELLEAEGVVFIGERVDMAKHFWDPSVELKNERENR